MEGSRGLQWVPQGSGEALELSGGHLSPHVGPAEPKRSLRTFWRATLPCQSTTGADSDKGTPVRASSVHVLTTGSREQASATTQGTVMHQEPTAAPLFTPWN